MQIFWPAAWNTSLQIPKLATHHTMSPTAMSFAGVRWAPLTRHFQVQCLDQSCTAVRVMACGAEL